MSRVLSSLAPLRARRVLVLGARGRLGDAVGALVEEAGAHVARLPAPRDTNDLARFASALEAALVDVDLVISTLGAAPGAAPRAESVLLELLATDLVASTVQVRQVPLVVPSTHEVRGVSSTTLLESFARAVPYPAAGDGARRPFSSDGERAFLVDAMARATRRSAHADVRSRLAREARDHLFARKEPTSGSAFDDEIARRERAFISALLTDELNDRARGYGFASPFAYTKALVELCVSRLPPASVRVVRLGRVIDDALVAAIEDLAATAPESEASLALDVLPLPLAAAALAIAAASAVAGRGAPVMHATLVGTPHALTIARARDALDLARRVPPREAETSTPERGLVRSLLGLASRAVVEARTEWRARTSSASSSSPLRAALVSSTSALARRQLALVERQLGGGASLLFRADGLLWHDALLAARPSIDAPSAPRARLAGPPLDDALRPYDTLIHLFTESTARYATRPALTRLVGDDERVVSYRELGLAVRAASARLVLAGVARGDRVVLSGHNQPEWPIAFFAIIGAGAIPVPVDPGLTPEQLAVIVEKARPRLCVFDRAARAHFAALDTLDVRDLALLTASAPRELAHELFVPARDDVASILFTSGTTGEPKGVMLTHRNFCSLIAALGGIFDMHGDDRALSLLPLHHTLEFSCGLLLPLAAGAHIFYVDELAPERVLFALKKGRITGMVGVPALWQALERKVRATVKEKGGVLEQAFETAMSMQRGVARRTGVDVGKHLFKPLHDALGGHLKILISGGAALPRETHALFQGIGLPLAEGYGLTETSPVLTVAEAGPFDPGGTVGRPIPGVEIRIDGADALGAGEIVARGPNVMKGYYENEAATRAAFTDDGWLKTGDLGRIDDDGRLVIVGRAKDVVVTSTGENIYLDDVEALIGSIDGVVEYTLVGVAAAGGGERLALVARAAVDVEPDVARERVRAACRAVATTYRPAIVELTDVALPRTATRKVKRKDVRAHLEATLAERDAAIADDAPPVLVVRQAIAALVGRDVATLKGGMSLERDLGFDSLYWVELSALLAPHTGSTDPEMLYAADTIAGVEKLVREHDPSARRRDDGDGLARDDDEKRALPSVVVRPGRAVLTRAQRDLFDTLFSTTVTGRAHIPWNTPSIVVANHCSHLDTGLVKFALGRYGANLRPLAAKDYFFEGNPLKVAFFESFTNLVPLDRESVAGRAFEQALDVVRAGSTVLIYPEGTRRTDGTLGEFKPLVGRLALSAGVPVVPVRLFGTFEALPKGARFPRARALSARIGPPLWPDALRRRVPGENPVADARVAASEIRAALVALGDPHVDDAPAPRDARRDETRARS